MLVLNLLLYGELLFIFMSNVQWSAFLNFILLLIVGGFVTAMMMEVIDYVDN